MTEFKATRVRHALGAPSRLLRLLLVGVLTACTAGDSPFMPGELSRAPLRIQPRFAASVVGSSLAASVNQVALTARNAANGAVLGVDTISVAALTDVIESPLEITLPSGTTSLSVIVTLEYLDFTPPSSFTVLFSGETEPITVNAGGTTQVPPPQVYPGPPSNLTITDVSVDPNDVTIDESASRALHATAEGASGEADIFWRVIDGNAVELSSLQGSDIMVEGVAPGVSRVEAAAGPRADTVEVTVLAIPASVEVSPDSIVVTTLGDVAAYTATVRDARGAEMADVPVSWTVVDGAVAASNGDGSFSALARGRTNVTAAAVANPGIAGSALLVVEPVATGLAIEPAAATLQAIGDTAAFTALAEDDAGNPVAIAVTWSITPDTVASIDANGRAVALRRGTAQVTASGAGLTATASLSVIPAPATITLAPSDTTLVAIGATAQLRAAASDANGNALTPAFTWSTSDTDIATVSATGLVAARGDGTATIMATAGGVSATATVHVDLPAPPPPPPPAQPNLVMRAPVVSADLIRAGDSATVTFVVVNTGADAPSTMLYLELIQDIEDVTFGEDTTLVLPAIAAGDSATVSIHDEFDFDLAPPTISMRIRATVDPDAQVAESNEEDNTADSAPFTFLGPASIDVTPASVTFTALGDSAQVTWVVKDINGEVLPDDHVLFLPADSVSGVGFTSDGWIYGVEPDTTAMVVVAGTISIVVPVIVSQVPDTLLVPEVLFFGQIGEVQTVPVALLDANLFVIPSDPVLTSANPSIVEIVTDSTARALAEGDTEITVQAGGLTAVIQVSVMPQIGSVDVLEETLAFGALGDTARISVTVLDVGGSPLSIPPGYTTRDAEVAGVDNGLITAIGNGATWVVAFAGESAADSVLVTVEQVADTIDAQPDVMFLGVIGQRHPLQVFVRDANGHPLPAAAALAIEDDAIVALDGDSVAIALAQGSTHIIASFEGLPDDTINVEVMPEIGSVVATPESLTFVALQDTLPIEVNVLDVGGTPIEMPVGYETEHPEVAIVDAGNVIAIGNGTTRIRVFAGEAEDWVDVTVEQVADSMDVQPDTLYFAGLAQRLPISVRVLDANHHDMVPDAGFVIEDETIVALDGDSVAVSLAQGSTRIIVSHGALEDTIDVVVNAPASSMTVGPDSLRLAALGRTAAIDVEVFDELENPIDAVAAFTSRNAAVASVDSNGQVTALTEGTTYVDVVVESLIDSVKVTVDQVADSLDVELSLAEVSLGSTANVSALAFDSTGHAMDPTGVLWTSSNDALATVAGDGTVSTLTTGTVVITGTLDGVQAADTLLVTVAVDGFTRVWVGGGLSVDASTEFGIASSEPDGWGNPANWSPAGVPGSADIVLIPANTGVKPKLYANHTVLDLEVEPSGQVRLNGHDLTVLRDLRAHGAVANASANGRLHACANPGAGGGGVTRGKVRGTVAGLRIAGFCDLENLLVADSIDVDGGELDLKGYRAQSNGRFGTKNGGKLRMQNAADELEVFGDLDFRGQGVPGYLSNGKIIARGGLKQTGACGSTVALQAGGAHVIQMKGVGAIDVQCADASLANLEIAAEALTEVASTAPVKVTGRLDAYGILQNAGDGNGVVAVAGEARVRAGNGRIALKELKVAGAVTVDNAMTTVGSPIQTYDVVTTTFTGSNQVIPTAHGHLKNVTVSGTAELTGDATTAIGGNLVVTGAGAKLKMPATASGQANVSGALTATGGGAIEMTQATHTLVVQGALTLEGSGANVLTQGTIDAANNVTVSACAGSAGAGHTLKLAGTAPVLNSTCELGSLEVAETSAAVLASDLTVKGNLDVKNRLDASSRKIDVAQNVTIASSTGELVAGEVAVGGALTATNAYEFNVETTTFDGATAQVIPDISGELVAYQKIKIDKGSAAATPATGSTITAQEIVVSSGSLSVEEPITVSGNFSTEGSGVLVMTQPDELVVGGDAVFAGGASDQITDGVIKVQGTFRRGGSCSVATFRASGNNVVELTGNATGQTISSDCSELSEGESGGLSISTMPTESTALTFATLRTTDNATTSFQGAGEVVIDGEVIVRNSVNSSMDVPVRVRGALTDAEPGMEGAWNVWETRLDSATINAAKLNTPQLKVLGRPILTSALRVTGWVTVEDGGTLDVGGRTLTITEDLVTTGTGILVMDNPLDSVLVYSDVIFGGGSTSGKLTDGVIRVNGNFTQTCDGGVETTFAASGNHTTQFTPVGTATVAFACPDTVGLKSKFGRFHVMSNGGVNFATAAYIEGVADIDGDLEFATEITSTNETDEIVVNGGVIGDAVGRWKVKKTRVPGNVPLPNTLKTVRFDADFTFTEDMTAEHVIIGKTNNAITVDLHGYDLTVRGTDGTNGTITVRRNSTVTLEMGGDLLGASTIGGPTDGVAPDMELADGASLIVTGPLETPAEIFVDVVKVGSPWTFNFPVGLATIYYNSTDGVTDGELSALLRFVDLIP